MIDSSPDLNWIVIWSTEQTESFDAVIDKNTMIDGHHETNLAAVDFNQSGKAVDLCVLAQTFPFNQKQFLLSLHS